MRDIKTADEIYASMKEVFAEKTGISIRDDADMSVRMRALAYEAGTLWTQTDWLLKQCFPQTASGECLERHAQLRGIFRSAAVASRGVMRFEISAPRQEALVIPKGVVCIAAGGTEFITDEEGTIPTGAQYCDVRAKAVRAGASGNVQADCIVYMSNPPVGIRGCRNPNAFSGGFDSEDDSGLRKRILGSYKLLPNGANVAYYETQTLEVEGVCAASVLPKRRGMGRVDIVISSSGGAPHQSLVDRVQEKLSAQREICVSIETLPPETVGVAVAADIKTRDGYEFSAVKSDVEQAVRAYFDGKLLAKNVLIAELGNVIFNVEGVANYKIAVPPTDIKVAEDELPVLLSVSVSDMG